MTSAQKKVVAIDGPAGAGKSSVAKQLAKKLGYSYLDTGAMYRALTLKAMNENVMLEDEEALVTLANQTKINLEYEGVNIKVMLDGKDVSEEIRTTDVTNNTFYVARVPRVREIMVGWQRKISSQKDVVIEGRDVTTVVFPNASNKYYLDADLNVRARRRIKELKDNGSSIDEDKLLNEINERDQKDFTREVGPLKQAKDAIYLDTTNMSVDQVVDIMLKNIKS